MSTLVIVLTVWLSGVGQPTQQGAIVETPIATLLSSYPRHDGEVVRVRGWLRLGSEFGVFVSDDRETAAIKLRHRDEVPSVSERATKDALFKEFWSLANGRTIVPKTVKIRVVFDGSVRILKEGGKPATSFDVWGQFPVELIPLRIVEIARE